MAFVKIWRIFVQCKHTLHSLLIQLHLNICQTYIALSHSSFVSGTVRDSIIPRFILAGSNAQFDSPMKATRLGLSSASMTSSLVTPSSSRGCRDFRGMRGESSASPTSSSTTTDTNLSRFLPSCSLLHCRKVATIPSGVERGLHW